MIITTTPNAAKLTHNGLPITSIAGRVSFTGLPCGKKMQIQTDWYLSVASFNNKDPKIAIQGVAGFPNKAITVDVDPLGDQGKLAAHEAYKTYLEALDYAAEIVGI